MCVCLDQVLELSAALEERATVGDEPLAIRVLSAGLAEITEYRGRLATSKSEEIGGVVHSIRSDYLASVRPQPC